MLMLLAYTALFAPFEVAFFNVSMGPLFVLNRIVDLCFISNVLIHFRLMYVIDRSGKRVRTTSAPPTRNWTGPVAVEVYADAKEVHTTCVDSFLRPSCVEKVGFGRTRAK